MDSDSESETLMFATGSKTLEIADYSMIVKRIGKNNGIWSERFTVGGYDWVIKLYPQGMFESVSDHVSVLIELLNTTDDVPVIYSFRLQDWTTSKWSATTLACSDLRTFSRLDGPTSGGYSTYIKRSVLEDSNYLKDDKLVINCTLWVACPRCKL